MGLRYDYFCWWILVGCFPDIVTYTQWNSYFEALGPGWIVIIQFAGRIAKRQFFVEKLLTIIFQGQSVCLQGQGVNTPKSLTTRPWKSGGWNTIPYIFNGAKLLNFPGSNAPKLALPWVFLFKVSHLGKRWQVIFPMDRWQGEGTGPEGKKGQQGGVEEGCSLLVLMWHKIQHFIRLSFYAVNLNFDGGFSCWSSVYFEKETFISHMFASSMYCTYIERSYWGTGSTLVTLRKIPYALWGGFLNWW